MPVIALITWIVTALGGLFLLAIWLIEYDPDFQRAAATRLPVPVISGHVLLALGGLAVWIIYLLTDEVKFAFATLAVLALVATFGLTMAVRWISVYRASPTRPPPVAFLAAPPAAGGPRDAWTPVDARTGGRPSIPGLEGRRGELIVPPERHFPLSVVIAHGIFAVVTIVLVLLTVLGVGAS